MLARAAADAAAKFSRSKVIVVSFASSVPITDCVLAPAVALVEDWTKRNEMSGAEADALLQSAKYPYSLT